MGDPEIANGGRDSEERDPEGIDDDAEGRGRKEGEKERRKTRSEKKI